MTYMTYMTYMTSEYEYNKKLTENNSLYDISLVSPSRPLIL